MSAFPFSEFEARWQKYWDDQETYRTDDSTDKPKYYVLDMFPYPSGAGLHVGHPEGYTASDIVARARRMQGFNVLHPMGFDAFGLPTEQYSMKTGIHPAVATADNVANFRRQLKMLGFSYDWSREVTTSDPGFYHWTQWIFRLIYNSWFDDKQKKARPIEELPIPASMTDPLEVQAYQDSFRLAYVDEIPVNWCEALGTVLANEEVDEWKEKGYSVVRRPVRQWVLRITAYAERLLEGLDELDWPTSTKEMQRHWIGRSEGARIRFDVEGHDADVEVFTTRPDTVFGSSYLVLAPEHALVDVICTDAQRDEVKAYIAAAALKSDVERTAEKEKSGVFTGAYATNPANGTRIPIWIADYVLAHYGSGAIMAVPGHDERDHEFARAFSLPIIEVVQPADGAQHDVQASALTEPGVAANSSNADLDLNGMATAEAKRATIDWLKRSGRGKGTINYRLRDWTFSRQRYWGDPMPIIHFEDGTRRLMDEDELPLELPPSEDFKPAGTGESPLAKIDAWVNYHDPKTGKTGRLETNTMPQWAGSCWYYLRYMDPHNNERIFDPALEQYWMGDNGVDLYVGGAEHAVLHLLYARFWHKVLFDYGVVNTSEPFRRLVHQGMIQAEDGRKMSKSLGNVVNPDDVVNQFGADTLRLFEMFMGPLADDKPWSSKGLEGVHRFLSRVWRMLLNDEGALRAEIGDHKLSEEQEFMLHATIKKVSEDIDSLSFNTAIAQMMTFVNEFLNLPAKPRSAMEMFLQILAPFAPHICEELWRRMGHTESIHISAWPQYDNNKLVKSSVEIVLQVNNKVRARVSVPADAPQAEVEAIAMADENIVKHIDGKAVRKIIYVPNKIFNIIAK